MYPKILRLPEEDNYKDVDERANSNPTPEQKEAFFAHAEDGFIVLLGQQERINDMNNPVERKRFLQHMYDVLLYVQDWTILSWYLETLAKKV